MSAQPVWKPSLVGYLLAPLLAAAATVTALAVERWIPVASLGLIYVLPVVILAVSFGWRSAMTAAVVSALAFNFFLMEPRGTLRVADPANVLVLLLLVIVATIVSALASQSRRRAEVATLLAQQAVAVQGLGRTLAGASEHQAILDETARTLSAMLGVRAAAIGFDGGREALATSSGALSGGDLEAARWAVGQRARAAAQAFPADGVAFDFWPAGSGRARAAIGIDLEAGTDNLPPDWERSLAIVGGLMAVALERADLAEQVLAARLRTESERVKADLLAAVSHDLKTPLSSILVSLQSLRRFSGQHDAKARDDLLAVAEAETARLSGLVGNLLDMSRIDADAVAVKPERLDVAGLVAGARLRAARALGGRPVVEHLDGAPDVLADASLTETALANVLENAAKYSGEGAPIEIAAFAEEGAVVLTVTDSGPGFPDPAEPLFGKFTRGVEGDGRAPGTGLGLAIARGFLAAQGATIEALNRSPGPGGLVRIALPRARQGRAAA